MLRKLRSLLRLQPAFLNTGEDFTKKLKMALSDPMDVERLKLRKLFKETSLEAFWTYYVAGNDAPHYHMPWEGHEMTKLPMDTLIYKELIESDRPDIVIEIGTQRGGSALFLASVLSPFGGKVITLDLISPPIEVMEEFKKVGIIFIKGDATTEEIAIKVESIVGSKGCLIIDDGSHRYDDVLAAYYLYSRFVRVGGYYVVEDGFTNWLIRKESHNALSAVGDILKINKEFLRDTRYDRFIFFSAFQGIMRRKAIN